jgi:hypothetical protein
MARPTGLDGDNVPCIFVWIFDPRDLHGYYLATFDIMPSKDEEQGGGPCPPTKAIIPPSICDCPGTCPTLSTKGKPTAVSTRSSSRSQSWSAAPLTKPPVLILESLLHYKPKDGMKPPYSFAQATVRPPSPDTSKPTPTEVAIAYSTSKSSFHHQEAPEQHSFPSLVCCPGSNYICLKDSTFEG